MEDEGENDEDEGAEGQECGEDSGEAAEGSQGDTHEKSWQTYLNFFLPQWCHILSTPVLLVCKRRVRVCIYDSEADVLLLSEEVPLGKNKKLNENGARCNFAFLQECSEGRNCLGKGHKFHAAFQT